MIIQKNADEATLVLLDWSVVTKFVLHFLTWRFGGRQIHASEDDGSVNHTLIRDYDAEVSRLDRFGEELEEST